MLTEIENFLVSQKRPQIRCGWLPKPHAQAVSLCLFMTLVVAQRSAIGVSVAATVQRHPCVARPVFGIQFARDTSGTSSVPPPPSNTTSLLSPRQAGGKTGATPSFGVV